MLKKKQIKRFGIVLFEYAVAKNILTGPSSAKEGPIGLNHYIPKKLLKELIYEIIFERSNLCLFLFNNINTCVVLVINRLSVI